MTGTDRMPVFVIKANDRLAAAAVNCYRILCIDSGLDEQAREVEYAIDEMREWAKCNPELMCWPDHEHVPAEGSAVTRKPSDLWQAVLVDEIGYAVDIDELEDADAVEIRIVRRSAGFVIHHSDDDPRLPGAYDPFDVAYQESNLDDDEEVRVRFAWAQAMARGLNAAELT